MASTEVTETAVFFWGSGRAAPRLARLRLNLREAGIHLRGCPQWLTAQGHVEGHIGRLPKAAPKCTRGSSRDGLLDWERDRDRRGRTLALGTLDRERASVQLRKSANQRQTEASPRLAADIVAELDKGMAQPRQVRGGNAHAGVRDRKRAET